MFVKFVGLVVAKHVESLVHVFVQLVVFVVVTSVKFPLEVGIKLAYSIKSALFKAFRVHYHEVLIAIEW